MKASLPPLHPVVNLIIRSYFGSNAIYCIWRFLLFIFDEKKPHRSEAIFIRSLEKDRIVYYNRIIYKQLLYTY
jgi:hypothetical protein